MRTVRLGWVVVFFLCSRPALFAQVSPQHAREKNATETAHSFSFEPLENWKTAVLSGDKVSLQGFYMASPPARAKTPQGEIVDPAEEPAFWSSLRPAGLDHLDIKVLEAKTLQPGVVALVLRFELGIKTSEGEKSAIVSCSQVWVQRLGDWKIISTQRSDLAAKEARRLPE